MKMDSMIFDVDGTLWDATKIVAEAWTEIARREYDPQITITFGQLQQLFGKLLPDIAANLFPRESPEGPYLPRTGRHAESIVGKI